VVAPAQKALASEGCDAAAGPPPSIPWTWGDDRFAARLYFWAGLLFIPACALLLPDLSGVLYGDYACITAFIVASFMCFVGSVADLKRTFRASTAQQRMAAVGLSRASRAQGRLAVVDLSRASTAQLELGADLSRASTAQLGLVEAIVYMVGSVLYIVGSVLYWPVWVGVTGNAGMWIFRAGTFCYTYGNARLLKATLRELGGRPTRLQVRKSQIALGGISCGLCGSVLFTAGGILSQLGVGGHGETWFLGSLFFAVGQSAPDVARRYLLGSVLD